MSLLDDIEAGELSTNSRLLRKAVPGYDYRIRGERADTDREVREVVVRELTNAKRGLDDVSDELFRADRREEVATVDSLKNAILQLERRVKTGSPGPLIQSVSDAGESEIIELIEFDAQLVNDARDVNQQIDVLYGTVVENPTSEDVAAELRGVRTTVRRLDRTYTGRTEHLRSLD